MRTVHTSMTSTFQKRKTRGSIFYEIFCRTEIYSGLLVAGLDCEFGSHQFPIFLLIVVIAISILVKTTF